MVRVLIAKFVLQEKQIEFKSSRSDATTEI